MYSFKNDYSEGAHINILNALVETNLEQTLGYSEDSYTERAVELIKQKVQCEKAAVHILPGGTQTNLTAISAFLRPYEAAIAVHTGHIYVHETGAIEATGHKVIAMPSEDGKMTTKLIEEALEIHTDEHMVKPKLVYISNSTEIGTIYKKAELEALYNCCQNHKLLLYIDGARLGSALCAEENDMTLADLAKYSDAFYIGGTKNGALMGEALVIVNEALQEDFRFNIKQRGALLAKGRLLGIQFVELFKEDLFFEVATHANQMAQKLQRGIESLGYSFMIQSPTNQIFPIFSNEIIAELSKKYDYTVWEKYDEDHTILRLVTCWATKEEAVDAFLEDLAKLSK